MRVNSVAPGPVDTPLVEGKPRQQITRLVEATQLIGRIAQPEEVRPLREVAAADACYDRGYICFEMVSE